MSSEAASPVAVIEAFYGGKPKVSDWVVVEQATIDKFAETTGDFNWIHVDPERSKRESPFGTTIAHGFWTMSMSAYFAQQFQDEYFPQGTLYGLNYGLDRVRFMSPVRVGKKIRCTVTLLDIAYRKRGRYLVKSEYKIEVEDEKKPAMVAQWLIMLAFPEQQQEG
jgi:acyl dehydratase